MSLPHLLLGLLAAPASGYDLKRAFDQSLRHLWAADLAQIYPTLQRLEADGYLRSREQPSSRGPVRRVYRRTAKGRRHLLQWLAAPPELKPLRLGYLAQLSLLGETGDLGRTRALLEEVRAAFGERLRVLEAVEQAWFSSAPGFPDELEADLFHGHLTVRAGITRLRAAVAWCDESLERVVRRRHG